MKYEYMISPFEYFIFDEFSKQETKEYFEWYVRQIQHRIEYLEKYIICNNEDVVFDYTDESLIPLWEWYEKKIVCVKKTDEELKKNYQETPKWLHDFIKADRLSYEAIGICVDIAAYFAEIIIKKSRGKLEWGYFTKPKNKVDVNRPVILGFSNKIHLNPIVVTYNCALRSLQERDPKRLYNILNVWMNYVE